MSVRVLVTGTTGFIGARLAARLASSAREVRCLVRDRGGSRARELEREGFDLHEGDVLRPETLRGAGHGVDVAYYLIHSMGRRGSRDFAAGERAAASAFARMARAEGIERRAVDGCTSALQTEARSPSSLVSIRIVLSLCCGLDPVWFGLRQRRGRHRQAGSRRR